MKKTTSKTPVKENIYRDLAGLLQYNLSLLSQHGVELISDQIFDKIGDKKSGMTVGKIITEKTEIYKKDAAALEAAEEEKPRFLLKKNGRLQELDEDGKILKKDSSRQMNLREGIAESFNEICAANLFNVLKKEDDYLPRIFLVRSEFNQDKTYNRLKGSAGVFKVYVASEIIGNPDKVNKDKRLENKTLLESAPNKERLLDDICENAVIMFLLSNYDLKLDNFVHSKDRLIPIDFGNARHEEKSSPDIISGIDAVRSTRNKVASSQFASSELRERFAHDHHKHTQDFYKTNLRPEHFLKVIEKIKEDQSGIETRLHQTAALYTFGTEKEKCDYADVLVARVRNLVKLEPVFTQFLGKKEFSNHNLRTMIVGNSEFEEDLLSTNSSEGKKFFQHISYLFGSIGERGEEIISLLGEYDSSNPESKKKIFTKVSDFNQFLENEQSNIQTEFDHLEHHYGDSDYMTGQNVFGDKDSWKGDRFAIAQKLAEIISTLEMPLVDEMSFFQTESSHAIDDLEYSINSVFKDLPLSDVNEAEHSNSTNHEKSNHSLSSDDSDEDEEVSPPPSPTKSDGKSKEVDWDLSQSSLYAEKLREMMEYVSEEYLEIRTKMLLLMTHLSSHDTLLQARSPSTHPTSTTESQKLVSTKSAAAALDI